MVNSLSIKNYKSVRKLQINTKRINVFIGEHNTGKSNILEALSWFSANALGERTFPEVFRFKSTTDFFYDNDASKPIEIKTNLFTLNLRYAKNNNGVLLNHFEGLIYPSSLKIDFNTIDYNNLGSDKRFISTNYHYFKLQFDGRVEFGSGTFQTPFRTYVFQKIKKFQNGFVPYLNPPFGENIPSLLVSNSQYKDLVSSVFKEKGFRLMLKPTEGDLNMAKDIKDELYSYPYASISETLQRIIFYMLAIETNKNSVIVLDEPESNTFPMYTKQLAELMALDKSNQYFIATHNPYLLGSLVGKTPIKDLAVFVTQMKDYETTALPVTTKKLSTILDSGIDIYFNLNKLVK